MPAASATSPIDRSEIRPRSTKRGELTAERILDEAEALFAERGYAGTTLRDVAERVGVRVPSLYNHFESKDALYAAVFERGVGPVLALLSHFVDAGEEAYRDTDSLIESVMTLLAGRPQLSRLVLHETLGGAPRLTPVLREWIAPTLARSRDMLDATPAARGWRPEHVPLLVLALYHAVVGYFAIAPLYKDLNGEDLLGKDALREQTRFLSEMVARLLPSE